MQSTKFNKMARRGRVITGLVLAAGLAATMVGCASGGGGGAKVLGLVEFDMTSASDAAFDNSTVTAFEGAGWEVLAQDPKGDPGQANTICTQYVTRVVTALVITTFAQDQMAQCLSQAADAKIPVFFLASPLLDGMAGAVDLVAAEPINDVFIKNLEANKVTEVLTLDYTPGTPCRLRAEYREKLIADSGLDINVTRHEFPIPGQLVDAQSATAAWLSAHPEGSGKFAIWACFTDPTAGALAAIQQAGRTDSLPLFTWDYGISILEAIRSGAVAADLWIDFDAMGGQLLELVDGYLADGKPMGVVAANVVLTADNIDAFLADHPEIDQ